MIRKRSQGINDEAIGGGWIRRRIRIDGGQGEDEGKMEPYGQGIGGGGGRRIGRAVTPSAGGGGACIGGIKFF